MKLLKRIVAFTLVELLVVISIIAILASLAIPAISGGMMRAQLTQGLSNCRQLAMASLSSAGDAAASGDSSIPGWPSTNSFSVWAEQLTNAGLGSNDIKKLLGASSTASFPPAIGDSKIYVYAVEDTSPGDMILFTSKNWDAKNPGALSSSAVPYGDKGFIVFRKGGDGSLYKSAQSTNPIGFFGSATNQCK